MLPGAYFLTSLCKINALSWEYSFIGLKFKEGEVWVINVKNIYKWPNSAFLYK